MSFRAGLGILAGFLCNLEGLGFNFCAQGFKVLCCPPNVPIDLHASILSPTRLFSYAHGFSSYARGFSIYVSGFCFFAKLTFVYAASI